MKYYLIIILFFILSLPFSIICKAEDPNSSPESYMFITEWGSSGDGNGDFKEPSGIAVSPEGYVYVADSGNNRIQKFDSNGKFIIKWGSGGNGDGQFRKDRYWLNPLRVAIDNDGNIYVTDSCNGTIQKFGSNGKLLKVLHEANPENIAIDSHGKIYIIDNFPCFLIITDSENNFLNIKWIETNNFSKYEGIKGESSFANLYRRRELGGSFKSRSIKVDSSGNIYLVIGAMRCCPCNKKHDNLFNGWIMKLDENFSIITEWGSEGKKDETFKKEKENLGNDIFATIALDSEGNVYVAECANNRIEKFDPNGILLARWGKEGSDDGEFKTPFGIDVDKEGNVYVLDYGNCRIQKFAPNPEYKSNK